jgi:hypothetical protein
VELNQHKLLSLKSWKDLAAKGQAPEGAVVLVSCEIPEVKQLDDHGNVFRFIISSSNPDRDKDVINVEGWNFLAACAASVRGVRMASQLRRTNSATRLGRRSTFPSQYRDSIVMLCP